MTAKELDDQREINRQWSELLDSTVKSPAVDAERNRQEFMELVEAMRDEALANLWRAKIAI